MHLAVAVAAVAALAIGVSAHPDPYRDKLNRPTVHDNLDYLKLGMNQWLPETTYTLSEWNNGYMPEECKNIVTGKADGGGTQYNPNDFQIFDVHYDDCGEPWQFCHHRSSNSSIDTVARLFGKLPIQMRQWIRHVIDVPSQQGHAFEWNGSVIFFAADNSITVFAHETAHSLDLNGAYADHALSYSDRWWNEYDQDWQVPDPYSNSNGIEDVAQCTVVSVFDVNVPGGFPSVEPNWGGIEHQIHLIQAEARDAGEGNSILIPGHNKECTHRMPHSNPVPMNGNSKRGPAPDVRMRSNVTLIDTSKRVEKHSGCTLTW
ncbi:hypothetical protein NLG97_g2944 [Lecanicillium saksenae]|uniref:Uncharacterized protein n=1 Tax=Lecanicillium saksenae TaxID=468837 RepID=A0ACC1R2V7_9HYPO|nr:hypothetical protein NLG97_g2944 [Lecanicillium saksenae]